MLQDLTQAIRHLNVVAKGHEIPNIFQPGLAKELIIAELLGHTVHLEKHGPDAYTEDGQCCEYLTSYVGGQVQLDRMFAEPEEKRQKSLQRITKYDRIYAVYFLKHTLDIQSIYLLDKALVLAEANRMLDQTKNSIGHCSFGPKFILNSSSIVKFWETV